MQSNESVNPSEEHANLTHDVTHHAHHGIEHDHHASHHVAPLARLYGLLKPDLKDIAVVALFGSVVGILSLATPLAVEALVNTIAFGRLVQPVYVLCGILLVFLGFAAMLRALQAWVVEVLQQRVFVRVVADLAWRLPRTRYAEFDNVHGPELLNRFFDVMTVQKAAATLVLDGTAIALQIVIGLAVLAFYHPYLLGFDLVLIATMTSVVWLLGRGAVPTAIEESKAKYAVGAWLEEIARRPSQFKDRLSTGSAEAKCDVLTSRYLDARRKHFRILMRQVCFALGLQAIAASALFGIGGYLVLKGELSLGQLVAAELIVSLIVGSFAKLGKHMESFYDLLAAVDKIGHLFDLPVERQTGHPTSRAEAPWSVALRDVEYAYPDGQRGLSSLNLAVKPGELVVITGAFGSGKTTLIDLLYALREPSHGHIEINDLDLRDLNLFEYREGVQLLREPFCTEGTLEENLTRRRPSITLEEVSQLLQELGLRDFVRELPQGLQTPLTTNGAPLSGQPLVAFSITRALLARPRLLLIDGTLDVLPTESIKQIMRVLVDRLPRTTIIITTNRVELLPFADQHAPLTPGHEPDTWSGDGERLAFVGMGA